MQRVKEWWSKYSIVILTLIILRILIYDFILITCGLLDPLDKVFTVMYSNFDKEMSVHP